MKAIVTHLYESPCGTLRLGTVDGRLCLCNWVGDSNESIVNRRLQTRLNACFMDDKACTDAINDMNVNADVIARTCIQLDEYFGRRRTMFDLPLCFVGTDFQKQVWQTLMSIPYGQTISYRQLAQRIGRERAVRAVANANRLNAIAVIAPCHRVIGSDNSLTGYSGGLHIKRFLIDLEAQTLPFQTVSGLR